MRLKNKMVRFRLFWLIYLFALCSCNTKFEQEEEHAVCISMEDISATAGEEIIVPVSIVENDGFLGAEIKLVYDNTVLEFLEACLTSDWNQFYYLSESTQIPKSNIVRLSYVFSQENTRTGKFLELHFKVKEGAEKGATADLDVTIQNLVKINEETVIGDDVCVAIKVE